MSNLLKNKYVIAGASFLLAILIVVVFMPRNNNKKEKVIKLKADTSVNTLISEDDIEETEMYAEDIPASALKTKEEAVGKYTKTAVYKDDCLTNEKVSAAPSDYGLYDLKAYEYALSVDASSLINSVAGKVLAGDVVTLNYYDSKSNPPRVVSSGNLEVLSVSNSKGTEVTRDMVEEDDKVPAVVTLKVNPAQSIQLVEYNGLYGAPYICFVARGENAANIIKAIDEDNAGKYGSGQ
ncbi:MAG: hypothetical protein PUF72_05635 [Clostridiales bacterium]|nr:hypothetical protein [Clostridiales bacterium]